MLKFLVPIDGSAAAGRAVDYLVKKVDLFKGPVEIHLLNVQPPIPYGGRVSSVIGKDKLDQYHQEEGMAALKPAMQKLEAARIKFHHHIGLGDAAEVISKYATEKGCDQVVMGTRGMGSVSNLVLGSVATKVLHVTPVPVLLVK